MSIKKYNQKHLTMTERIWVEKGLNDGESFASISRRIEKHPTTIAKEVNDDVTLKLLTNEEVLEIQEKSHCAHQLFRTESEVAWIAPYKEGCGCYFALFNISEVDREIMVDLEEFELENYKIAKELWSQETCDIQQILKVEVKKHGAVIYRFE